MNDTIIIKINKVFKDNLKKEAEQKGLTLSSYIKSILAERKK